VEAGGGAGGAVIAAIGEREKSRRGRRRLPVPAGASAAVRAVCVGVERELCVVVPLATIGVTPPVTSSLLVEVWLVSVSAAFTFLFPVFFFFNSELYKPSATGKSRETKSITKLGTWHHQNTFPSSGGIATS